MDKPKGGSGSCHVLPQCAHHTVRTGTESDDTGCAWTSGQCCACASWGGLAIPNIKPMINPTAIQDVWVSDDDLKEATRATYKCPS
jgi:hypothetical protein